MAASPSVLTTLLGNIVADLENVGQHADVAAIIGVDAASVFTLLHHATPYVVVVPGTSVGEGEEADRGMQPVDVWIVHAKPGDAIHERTLLGTALAEGVLTLERVIRQALERPEPYAHAPFNAAPYTKQDGTTVAGKVVAAWSVGVDAPEIAPVNAAEETAETELYVRQRVAMSYLLEEGA